MSEEGETPNDPLGIFEILRIMAEASQEQLRERTVEAAVRCAMMTEKLLDIRLEPGTWAICSMADGLPDGAASLTDPTIANEMRSVAEAVRERYAELSNTDG